MNTTILTGLGIFIKDSASANYRPAGETYGARSDSSGLDTVHLTDTGAGPLRCRNWTWLAPQRLPQRTSIVSPFDL
jgi:hypothetical protein